MPQQLWRMILIYMPLYFETFLFSKGNLTMPSPFFLRHPSCSYACLCVCDTYFEYKLLGIVDVHLVLHVKKSIFAHRSSTRVYAVFTCKI